ncbi:MAG TPA: hypothetical protein VGQ83_28430 [Polyangia bacterium]|jgi:hypothetical protein
MANVRVAGLCFVVLGWGCGPGAVGAPVVDGGRDATVHGDGPAALDGPLALTLVSMAITPSAPTLTCTNGESCLQQLGATGTYSDGSTGAVDPSWTADRPEVGAIDWQTGLYTAVGSRGGVTTITATLGAVTAQASLTVRVVIDTYVIGGTMPNDPAPFFAGAAGTDAARAPQVLYPEHDTVYPVGVYPPEVQWQGGAQNDLFRVRLTDQFLTITAYTTTPAFQMGAPYWGILGASNAGGPVTIEVAATSMQDAAHTVFTAAPRTLRLAQARLGGTVYYWDLAAGKILRIRPGTAVAEEFFTPPPLAGTTNTCVACHTLSRDGRKMAFEYYGGGGSGGVADVATGSVTVAPDVYNAHFSTFNPDGSRLVTSWSEGLLTLRDAATGSPVPTGSGEGNLTALGAYNSHPVWSADGGLLAYACQGTPASWSWDVEFGASALCTVAWSQAAQIFDPATVRTLVPNDGLAHFYPTFSADNRFIVYNQGETCPYGTRSLDQHLSLWGVTATGGTPVRLARAAPGDQEFYPNFSPFIEGGYHYVAFYSRRAYGWRTAPPKRQIWVAAIDRDPVAGTDPSHPAFWLPGQSTAAENTSAFWAPEPCHSSAEACESDLDCCGGLICDGPTGAKTCSPPVTPCVKPGQVCTSSGECCAGLTCAANSAGEQVCTQVIP